MIFWDNGKENGNYYKEHRRVQRVGCSLEGLNAVGLQSSWFCQARAESSSLHNISQTLNPIYIYMYIYIL